MVADRRQPSSHPPGAAGKVAFTYDGKKVEACEGDTVASALYASGVRIFSRSFKYHRPRGLLCLTGDCPNCLMNVDGVPNVRICTMPAASGLRVKRQNAWPSARFDVFSVLDRLDRLMPVGFYYKTLIHPLLWRLAEPVVRRIAGLGKVDLELESDARYEHENRRADLVVVGAGPAGASAALEAARGGVEVTLIDKAEGVGGRLRGQRVAHPQALEYSGLAGREIAERLADAVAREPNIEALMGAAAIAFYEGNLLAVRQGERFIKLRAKRVIVATGATESPSVFHNNDLPGVMLSTAVQRLLRVHGAAPGKRALVVTSNDHGYVVANDLLDAGVEVAEVADERPSAPADSAHATALLQRGVPITPGATILRAEGVNHVRGAVLACPDEHGNPTGRRRRVTCDLITLATGFEPAVSLLAQRGLGAAFDSSLGEVVASDHPPHVYAAGDVTGIFELEATLLQGCLAGRRSAASLGRQEDPQETAGLEARLTEVVGRYKQSVSVRDEPARGPGRKRFVCICEDVTEKDLAYAIDEGFRDVQTLKRYSTATMGPCQGRMCSRSFSRITAQLTGMSAEETGSTTARPPLAATPLGLLAGPGHMPVKASPLERRQRVMGAAMMNLGQWRRPFSYTFPMEEAKAVHERVGVIDLSSLGKLEVVGEDAPSFLDRVYTYAFSTLGVGRIRYGVMCSNSGTIIDDGTVTRLAPDRYFITTTTGNVDAIEEWLKLWLAGTGQCVHIANLTSALAAVNVAGPRARDTLVKLTGVDLSPNAFRYMRSVDGEVAGVPSRLMKLGFVGESGWEIHFPAEYAEHVWDAVMEAGAEFGIAPFGMEAQRILRLEKKHVIVGQDTDAMSNPLEADMEWVVRFDKPDFIGKQALEGIRNRGYRNRLVGFVMNDATVPPEGNPVVAGGRPVGRVTSSRLSPTLNVGYGLMWAPVELAEEGVEVHIQINDQPTPARVTLQPFYDPDGLRLRE